MLVFVLFLIIQLLLILSIASMDNDYDGILIFNW